MSPRNFHLHDGEKGSALAVRLRPLADQDQVNKIRRDGTIEIHLAANTADLNQPLRKYLSQILGIQAQRINIVAGKTGTEKLVSILDMEPQLVQEKIFQHLE